jgi:hypothetical protein
MTDKREPTLAEAREAFDVVCTCTRPECRVAFAGVLAALERAARRGGHARNCRCVWEACEINHAEAIYHQSGHHLFTDPACAKWRETGEPDAE